MMDNRLNVNVILEYIISIFPDLCVLSGPSNYK